MVEVECEYCSNTFDRIPSRVERVDHTFCDTDCQNKWQESYHSGEGNPSWSGGKEKVYCDECGDSFKKWPSEPYRFCSMDCKALDERIDVETAPSKYFYNSKVWADKRVEIRKRDKNKCQWCKSDENLDVHHIRPMSMGGDELSNNNLVTLCKRCHGWAHNAIKY